MTPSRSSQSVCRAGVRTLSARTLARVHALGDDELVKAATARDPFPRPCGGWHVKIAPRWTPNDFAVWSSQRRAIGQRRLPRVPAIAIAIATVIATARWSWPRTGSLISFVCIRLDQRGDFTVPLAMGNRLQLVMNGLHLGSAHRLLTLMPRRHPCSNSKNCPVCPVKRVSCSKHLGKHFER